MNKKSFIIIGKERSQSCRDFYKRNIDLDIKAVWFGVTTAFGIWFLTGAACLLWVVVSNLTTYNLGMYLYLLGILGVLVGATAAGKRSPGRGWLHGLWVGLLLGIFGVIINLEFVPELYSWGAIGRQLLVWTLWGVTGGYIGSYLRSSERGKAVETKRKLFSRGR